MKKLHSLLIVSLFSSSLLAGEKPVEEESLLKRKLRNVSEVYKASDDEVLKAVGSWIESGMNDDTMPAILNNQEINTEAYKLAKKNGYLVPFKGEYVKIDFIEKYFSKALADEAKITEDKAIPEIKRNALLKKCGIIISGAWKIAKLSYQGGFWQGPLPTPYDGKRDDTSDKTHKLLSHIFRLTYSAARITDVLPIPNFLNIPGVGEICMDEIAETARCFIKTIELRNFQKENRDEAAASIFYETTVGLFKYLKTERDAQNKVIEKKTTANKLDAKSTAISMNIQKEDLFVYKIVNLPALKEIVKTAEKETELKENEEASEVIKNKLEK